MKMLILISKIWLDLLSSISRTSICTSLTVEHLTVSGGQMNFNGTYVGIFDLFESFIEDDGLGDEEPTVEEVTGFGVMGCN
jgi:hypothetical protein